MRIWKWELKITDLQTVDMPRDAKIMSVQMQSGKLCLWAMCWPINPTRPRNIAIYGTGNPVPNDPGEYIGTAQQHDGALVWHVFDLGDNT